MKLREYIAREKTLLLVVLLVGFALARFGGASVPASLIAAGMLLGAWVVVSYFSERAFVSKRAWPSLLFGALWWAYGLLLLFAGERVWGLLWIGSALFYLLVGLKKWWVARG